MPLGGRKIKICETLLFLSKYFTKKLSGNWVKWSETERVKEAPIVADKLVKSKYAKGIYR